LLRWPEHRVERAALERARRPRLLLLDDAAVAPPAGDDLEDWTRAGPGTEEATARVAALSRRSRVHAHGLEISGRRLHRGARSVTLTATQSVIMAPLVRSAGHPMSRTLLIAEERNAGLTTAASALRARLVRLDRAVTPLGVRVRLLSGSAVMLEVLPEGGTTFILL